MANPHWRMLAFRLAGVGIHYRRDQAVDPTLCGELTVPVHRCKQATAPLPRMVLCTRQHPAVGRAQANQTAIGNSQFDRILRVYFAEGFAQMAHQPRGLAGARHSVPLIADATGVQHQWITG
ncbi:hypothetical protein D3C80_1437310 [compost metagenome]